MADLSPITPDKGYSNDMCDFLIKCLTLNQEHRWTAEQLLAHPWVQDVPDCTNLRQWRYFNRQEDFRVMMDVVQEQNIQVD